MTDPVHLADLKQATTVPLHQKLIEAFAEMARDPEKGAADYATGLKAVLEENLIEESADAVPGSND